MSSLKIICAVTQIDVFL